MKNDSHSSDSKSVRETFSSFIHQHNLRMIRMVLGIFITLDCYYYFRILLPTLKPETALVAGVIPMTLGLGLLIEIYLIVSQKTISIFLDYIPMTFILGSRLLYGAFYGFDLSVIVVYTSTMLLFSALFYFNHKLFHVLLALQLVLHIEAAIGHIGNDPLPILLITNIFALSATAISWDRYNKKYQSFLLNNSILEKNKALEAAQTAAKISADQLDQHLKQVTEAQLILKGLLDHTSAAIALVDFNLKPQYYNNHLESLCGYGFTDIDDALLSTLIGDEATAELNSILDAILTGKISKGKLKVSYRSVNGGTGCAVVQMTHISIAGSGYILVDVNDITAEIKQQKKIEALSHMKDAVLAINHKLAEDTHLSSFFDYVLTHVKPIMPHADLGCILLLEADETLHMVAHFGYTDEMAQLFKLPLVESFAYRIAQGNLVSTQIINNVQKLLSPDFVSLLENKESLLVNSSISGPIMMDGKLYGLINIDSKENYVYTEDDVAIMEYLREQLGIALTLRDMYKKNLYLSRHDQLTGFMNRWYLNEIEANQIARWQRYGTQVSICTMDLNHLKLINDSFGHHEGDAYIKLYSQIMVKLFRSTDALIRLGGDEFAGVFYEMDEVLLSTKLEEANRLLHESDLQKRLLPHRLGFAYGISEFGKNGSVLQELLQLSDAKMYLKKVNMKKDYF